MGVEDEIAEPGEDRPAAMKRNRLQHGRPGADNDIGAVVDQIAGERR